MMSIEETNKAAKRSYIDAFKARDLSIFDRLFDPNYVIRYAGFADFRRDELRGMVSGAFESLSEVELDIEDMVAQGDKVVTRFTFKARHVGNFLGVPATQRTITWSGIVIDRFVDGRIVEAWEIFDRFGLFEATGGDRRIRVTRCLTRRCSRQSAGIDFPSAESVGSRRLRLIVKSLCRLAETKDNR